MDYFSYEKIHNIHLVLIVYLFCIILVILSSKDSLIILRIKLIFITSFLVENKGWSRLVSQNNERIFMCFIMREITEHGIFWEYTVWNRDWKNCMLILKLYPYHKIITEKFYMWNFLFDLLSLNQCLGNFSFFRIYSNK